MTVTRKTTITTLALGIATLAGCGTAATATHSASHPASSAAPAAARDDAPATGPGDILVKQTAREGQPFYQAGTYSNGEPWAWTVRLDSAACGGASLFSPAIIGAELADVGGQPSPGAPAGTTLPPPAGQKWCLIRFTVTNNGHANQVWGGDGSQYTTVNAGQDAYAPAGMGNGSAEEAQQAYSSYAEPGMPSAGNGLNPQETGTSWGVYAVPASAQITSVSVPDGGAPINGTNVQALITFTHPVS